MTVEKFKRDFKRLNGVYITGTVIMFRTKPIEFYDVSKNVTLATFDTLDTALSYEIHGKTVEEYIADMEEITFPPEFAKGNSGLSGGFSGRWTSALGSGSGDDNTTYDHPARMNVKIGIQRTYEDMLKAFTETHAAAGEEHGVVVDQYGFATKYRHGNTGSISGLTGNGTEIAIHNHPSHGWPTFSKEDVVNTALGTRRGIVAVSSTQGRGDDSAKYAGTYSFVKGQHFNAPGFVKAVSNARISGKDYNDAVNRWLTRNQKKYGYTYSYTKAKA